MSNVYNFPADSPHPGDIRRPQLDINAVRAAAAVEGGETTLVDTQLHKLHSANPGVEQSLATIRHADERIGDLEVDKDRISRQLASTNDCHSILTREIVDGLHWFSILSGVAMIPLALAGMWMMAHVIAVYITKSGGDLYANDPGGAMLFVGVASLASGALKAFEHRLITDWSRRVYNWTLFVVGLGAFNVWAAMVALSFSPPIRREHDVAYGGRESTAIRRGRRAGLVPPHLRRCLQLRRLCRRRTHSALRP